MRRGDPSIFIYVPPVTVAPTRMVTQSAAMATAFVPTSGSVVVGKCSLPGSGPELGTFGSDEEKNDD